MAFVMPAFESTPTARGTVVVPISEFRSTPTSCVVAAWAADSVGLGAPVRILNSDEDQIGRGEFHRGDYPGGYYDKAQTECAFDFEVVYTPGPDKTFYVAHGDYWSSELSEVDLEEGVVLRMPSSLNG